MNRVILIGRVGKDPELGQTPNGVAVGKFTLATSEKYKDKEITEWHTIRCWRGTAEFASKWCTKGAMVAVEGKLRTETWEKDGQKRSQVLVEADDIRLLARKNEGKPMQEVERENYEPQSSDLPF